MRGYEHIYLVQPATRRDAASRPRVLYWFRSPPGVKVGREPFDEPVRRALEAHNPDVVFDWETLITTAIPPSDGELWRERRRLERTAKQARLAAEREEALPEAAGISAAEIDAGADSDAPTVNRGPRSDGITTAAETSDKPSEVTAEGGSSETRRRHRRRGGRRRKRRPGSGAAQARTEAPEASESVELEPSPTPPGQSRER